MEGSIRSSLVVPRLASLALALLVWSTAAGPARADTTPLAFPSLCVDDATGSGAGTIPWSAANEAQTDTGNNADHAQTLSMGPTDSSHYLKCTGFGFSVPTKSVIDSVTMQVSRRRAANTTQAAGDAHVFAVAPGRIVGSIGTDKPITPCTDWTTTFNTKTYTDPTWGITWDACDPSMAQCGAAFNVNNAAFGAALAAKTCNPNNSTSAWVDYVNVQVAYTVTPCGGLDWTPPAVTPLPNPAPGATTTYTIQTDVPNRAGCALDPGALVSVTFPAGTDVSGVSGTFNTKNIVSPTKSGTTVTFAVPAGAFNSTCAGQPCLEITTHVTIVLNGVKNPTTEGDYTLTVSASPTISGATGTTTSAPYTVVTPCVTGPSGSAWGAITVTQDHPEVSLPDCPRIARYTIHATLPTPGGCSLVHGASQLAITLPPGSDVSKIMNTTVAGMPATKDTSAAPLTVKLTPSVDVGASLAFDIVLDVVQNQTTAGTSLTLVATGTKMGGTASGTSTGYGTATTTCGPTLDFYVRDWTTTTAYDDGHTPSSTNSMGVAEPDWAHSSDVWNQNASTVPAPGEFAWVAGADPVLTGSNFAFAAVSLATTGAELTYRPVSVEYFFSPFSLGMPFASLGAPLTHVLPSNMSNATRKVLPGFSWTVPSGVPAGTHSCLAVEISSQSDPLPTGTTLNGMSPSATDMLIRNDNNRAQRNLTVLAVPPPPPPPPPAPSPGSGGGKMSHFAMAHNAGTATQTMVVRMDVSKEAREHLRDARAVVVGGESMPLESGGTLRLADMKPGEIRWIGVTYSVASGAEGAMIPVGFSEMDEKTVVNAVTFGITPSPIATVVRSNIGLHRDVFTRLASVFGVAEGKATATAATSLLKAQGPLEERYVRFLKEQQRLVEAAVSKLLHTNEKASDPFGLRDAVKELVESVGSGYVPPSATAHLTLLEKLDSFTNMIEYARGNPLDILQMVKWQRELYATVPQLKALDASAEVVKESDAFIASFDWRKANAGGYAALLGQLQKPFRATAGALAKSGVDVAPELAQMQKQRSTAALEKAHRDYLLKLDGLRSAAAAERS